MLAELGYVAFALDMYGEVATGREHAMALITGLVQNPPLLRKRAAAGFDVLKAQPGVDTGRLAAIGYCFGGGVVLEMARRGMDLASVVSFHGGLATQRPAQKGQVKAQILVCHGADDTFDPPEHVANFQKEMTDAGVTWQMNIYSGAQHAFTNANADKAGIKGVAYNKTADERSWEAMQQFFKTTLGR